MTKHKAVVEAYERGLESFENHERPAGYPGLTNDTRRAANIEQFDVFFASYWPKWRYVKILLYRRMLEQRDPISVDLKVELEDAEASAESRVFQEISNGIIASAATEVCEYAEDLSALFRIVTSDRFAKDLKQISGGRNDVVSWSGWNTHHVKKAFFIPDWPNGADEAGEQYKNYVEGIERCGELLKAAAVFYSFWYFHFIAYKHGLALALRPHAKELSPENIATKRTTLSGHPVAFDSTSIDRLVGEPRFQQTLQIPNFNATNARLNARALARENNLLRYANPPLAAGRDPIIDDFQGVAFSIYQMQTVLLTNVHYFFHATTDERKFVLPKERGFSEVTIRMVTEAPSS